MTTPEQRLREQALALMTAGVNDVLTGRASIYESKVVHAHDVLALIEQLGGNECATMSHNGWRCGRHKVTKMEIP